ncbi:MAG: SUMF1/EgtB/PvdO family nonheme iron enzyme, partial [Verrucomicrobiota bacterium]
TPYLDDLWDLKRWIERERGREGLQMPWIPHHPEKKDLVSLPPGIPVLAVSAMGQLSGKRRQSEAWLRTGRWLAQRGHPLSALLPCPATRWSDPKLARVWRSAAWDPRTPLRRTGQRACPSQEHDSGGEALLNLLAPATIVERGLLRSVRQLLGSGADAAAEYDAWFHEDCWAARCSFGFSQDKALPRLEEGVEDRVLREAAGELISAYHAPYSSMIAVEAEMRLGRSLDHEALWSKVLARLRQIAQSSGEEEGLKTGLTDHLIGLVRRLPPKLRRDPAVSACLACAYHDRGDEEVEWMEGVNVEVADGELKRLRADPGEERIHQLFLAEGGSRVVSGEDAIRPGIFPLVSIARRREGLEVKTGESEGNQEAMASLTVNVEEATVLTLDTDVQGVHFCLVDRPSWATTMGRDRYGVYGEVEVKEVLIRLRWIPPGRFVMGDEKYGPVHQVTLSTGYWMAETQTTQRLWTAVMGKNPSHFQQEGSELHPVEKVSWNESREFCRELNGLVPELAFSLPTEAQWEYACRAGTLTRFSNGSDDENKFAEIAWYNGNSDHKTHVVGQKEPNPWGLSDMHGNVWEWCLDGWRDYTEKGESDPLGPTENSAERVLRGGGWAFDAGICRSAYRRAFEPGSRSQSLGLRLLAGQPDPGGNKSPVPGAEPPGRAERALQPVGLWSRDAEVPWPEDWDRRRPHRPKGPSWATRTRSDEFGSLAEVEWEGVVFGFRSIPAGTFRMGSPEEEEGRFDREGPLHEVTLTEDYWIGTTPVTQAQWEAVMGANPSHFAGRPNHPVETVSWKDCQTFLERMQERLPGLHPSLPTEAQW